MLKNTVHHGLRNAVAAFGLCIVAGCASAPFTSPVSATQPHPWTNQPFPPQTQFQFAIVADRTGGHRPGVFEHAVEQLNLLQPEFVINVGDMIEGYTDDKAQLDQEWNEFESLVGGLNMPFFHVVGNHDMGNATMLHEWQQRFGPTYYTFRYKDVLFITLNTEDPPVALPADFQAGIAYFKKLMKEDPAAAQKLIEEKGQMSDRNRAELLPVAISEQQVQWVEQVLADNADVRWTFLFMHKPAWEPEFADPQFAKIEALLQGRNYTVFGGHQHNYKHYTRNGTDYIRLGTTGGVWHHAGEGNTDHVTLVSVTDAGPRIANVRLDGMFDKNGPAPAPAAPATGQASPAH